MAGIGALVSCGSIALLPLWIHVARLWASDPLRFLGAIFPLISLFGVVGAWRKIGWTLDGRLWGLVPVLLSIELARVVGIPSLEHLFQGKASWLVHPGLVLFVFGAGAVCLFGGPRLLRAGIAPLCLLLVVNPVPGEFNTYLDMPLQQMSASTARAFAHLIGLQPTGEQLRMMFAPDFGMMIVPGCDGIRGSITFAYLALIFGYMRRLRPGRLSAITACALLLGYAMNLVRLCTLVLYYRAGLDFPSIRPYGEQVDYLIGCSIFMIGTLAIGYVIRSIEPATLPPAPEAIGAVPPGVLRAESIRALCFAALALIFIVAQRHLFATALPLTVTKEQVLRSLPASVGAYRLAGTDEERNANGTVAIVLADYIAAATASEPESRITLGLYVAASSHTVRASKSVQGIVPVWSGAFDAGARSDLPIYFGTSLYDDGHLSVYDAETHCSDVRCTNPLLGRAPSVTDVPFADAERSLPILLRRSWPDADTTPAAQQRARFEGDVRRFASQLDVPALVREVGFPL